MTIGRDGKWVYVGWQPHEIIWVKAALTLPQAVRFDAFKDIAAMRGCHVKTVRNKASEIKRQMKKAIASKRRLAPSQPIMIRWGRPVWTPGSIATPDKQRLMAGRA